MKWILLIVMTMGRGDHPPVAMDHIEFKTQAACEAYKAKVENNAGKSSGGGSFMGAVNAINNTLSAPIVTARCDSVEDGPTQ